MLQNGQQQSLRIRCNEVVRARKKTRRKQDYQVVVAGSQSLEPPRSCVKKFR